MLLFLYTAIAAALAPLAPVYVWARDWRRHARRSRPERRRGAERLGRASTARPRGRLVWLAAGGADDLAALISLIEKLSAAGYHVLTTTRGGELPARAAPFAIHQYAPLDAPVFVARFLASWRPDVALVVGSECWPNLLGETRRRGSPLILIDGRMPDRLFRVLRLAPKTSRAIFSRFDFCLPRSREDGARLRALGAHCGEASGDPRFDLAPRPADADALGRLSARIGARPVWAALVADAAAADLVVEAHRRVACEIPGVLTLLRLRPASLAAQVAGRARKLGAAAETERAAGEDADAGPRLLIYGQMQAATLLRAAGLVFLGRSTGARPGAGAGLDPVEAARLGCAILYGPDVGGFGEIYAALEEAGGCLMVENAEALAAEAVRLLSNMAEIRAIGRAAAERTAQLSGATSRIMRALTPTLDRVFLPPGIDDEGFE